MVRFFNEDEKIGVKKVKSMLKDILDSEDYKNTQMFMEKVDGIEAMAIGNHNTKGLYTVFLVRKSDELYKKLIEVCNSYINKTITDGDEFIDEFNTCLEQILAYNGMYE